MKKWTVLVVLVSGLTFLSFTPTADRYFEIAKNLDIFAGAFREINTYYVDEVNPNTLMRTGIDAMLASLDPFTNYIPENEVEDFRTINTGQYGGIGAVTREINGKTIITMMYEGYPAYRGGLRIGDEVIKMDEVELSKITIEQANQLMHGQVGTPVSLTVRRLGVRDPIKLQFKREKIKISNVPYFGMIGGNVGYLRLSNFTPDAGKEVRAAVVSLKESGAKAIVLDLRENPGGLLDEAVKICNIFLPKGKLVVTMKGKIAEFNSTYNTEMPPTDLEIPVAVVINRNSASASEIVAGTLQDYDRAIIVGEKSYGKGLVQLTRQLGYNSQVKITTAKYYTPTGRCIQVLDYSHRRPDGSVGSVPDSLKKEFKTANGRTVYDGGGIDPDINLSHPELAPISEALLNQGLIFDYATLYASKHATIGEARNFSFTDADYQDFVGWLKTKSYTYQSPLEDQLQRLKTTAKAERLYDELKTPIDQLQTLLAESRKNDLNTYKEELRKLLEEEIVGRYFMERGKVEVTFKDDPEIRKSVEVLLASAQYNKILSRP
ncbi:MAG: S41 family peptidase [Cyclobacteriaceae bacterium]|nr:S41 family peptidase [Cyclobacteriaceae bacterium]